MIIFIIESESLHRSNSIQCCILALSYTIVLMEAFSIYTTMKKQLSFFKPPNEDPAKISSLIRSESSHKLGLTLAKANSYNHVEFLIDLLHYHLRDIDIEAWMSRNEYFYHLAKFGIDKTECFFSELEGEGFYLTLAHGEDKKVDLKIYEWDENSQWGDFDLAKLAEKQVRKNRQYIDAVLKNKA